MLKTAAPHLADLASGRPKVLASAAAAPALRALADGGFEVWALDEGTDAVGLVASLDGDSATVSAPVVAVASPRRAASRSCWRPPTRLPRRRSRPGGGRPAGVRRRRS